MDDLLIKARDHRTMAWIVLCQRRNNPFPKTRRFLRHQAREFIDFAQLLESKARD